MESVILCMRVSLSDGSLKWRRAETTVGVLLPALEDQGPLPLFVVAHPS